MSEIRLTVGDADACLAERLDKEISLVTPAAVRRAPMAATWAGVWTYRTDRNGRSDARTKPQRPAYRMQPPAREEPRYDRPHRARNRQRDLRS
jgi:hypothetical protein